MKWPFEPLQPFGYDLIMADPPWQFGHLAAQDCLLWLWATNPLLDQAFEVVKAWGFRFVTAGTWVKTTTNGKIAFGTGYRLRSANEPFLLAMNGKPDTARNVRSVVMGPVREHSRKPDEAFAAAEALMPDARRLELFSRQSRPGWDTWGNEATKFDEATS